MLVWASESDLQPSVHHPAGAYGLSQVTQNTARITGHSWEWVQTTMPKLSATEHVRQAIRAQYMHYASLRKGQGFPNAQSLYAFNAAPGSASTRGIADSAVLMRKGAHEGYEGNKELDLDKDGALTVGDLRIRLSRVQHSSKPYKLALSALNEVATNARIAGVRAQL